MKLKILIGLVAALLSSVAVFAQVNENKSSPARPRVVINDNSPAPSGGRVVVVTDIYPKGSPTVKPTPYRIKTAEPSDKPSTDLGVAHRLSYGEIKRKIAEAEREMKARPIPTAMTDSFLVTDIIRLAFYDWRSKDLDYVVMSKEAFLKTGAETPTMSSDGKFITVRTIRGNGVNTPVTIIDRNNVAYLPLLVQYPRENGGVLQGIAYYISTHPGLVTPEVVNAGKLYVRNTIDIARDNLNKKGIFITPQVTDMAERLAVVEHVDHSRFRQEYRPTIYNDIFTLFALNEGDTYKYSVSSAGAGGMVQMIPWTYRMIRSRYPQVGLMPDFVEGMRNHVNASQAMLLYMQMTWFEMIGNSTITQAVADGIATPAELMSAGYNSNPSKLPGYIRRGGASWKTLIPKETQIYLEINASLDEHVPLIKRIK